ncbi:MAG: hypothetical protein LBE12_13580, partial [Planctomycetaceae bacterium]|nr:hypothetical protein [Planctomycetaceae bacterium]
GVTYLDNNLYGGRDRIFDITKEGKSLLLYPGPPNYLILEPGVATPGSCIHKQLQWLNWF